MMNTEKRGGKRVGAGRKHSEKTKQMRVPESVVDAVNSLKKIAKGTQTDIDLAEIAIVLSAGSLALHDYTMQVERYALDSIRKLESELDNDFMNTEIENKINILKEKVKKLEVI